MDQAQQLRNVVKEKNIKKNPKIASDARVLTITSGKGGVGKSNLAVNLAIQLRKFGKRVIIFSLLSPVKSTSLTWADSILCGYSYSDYSIQALFAALAGDFSPDGKLPFTPN